PTSFYRRSLKHYRNRAATFPSKGSRSPAGMRSFLIGIMPDATVFSILNHVQHRKVLLVIFADASAPLIQRHGHFVYCELLQIPASIITAPLNMALFFLHFHWLRAIQGQA